MSKTKLAVFAVVASAVAAISVLAVQADTTPLVVTCAGAVSNNQITWTASPSGGNAPYALAWSGDTSVTGSTSTSILATYGTNGTYTAMIQATDASSTIATSTCQATVTSNVVVPATSTLNVYVGVNNTAGGSATPASFTVTVSGNGATPGTFAGSNTGTTVVLNASSTFSVGASSVANYTMTESGNCSGTLVASSTSTCTVTETFVAPVTPPTPTSTPPAPRVNPPSLSIGPNGNFLGRGMTVTSVASGSFQASVWGITYTINWSGNLFPEFYFRGGNSAGTATNPTQQVAVGDEVGVSGEVTSGNPMVVTANVVRDYSITMPRPMPVGHGGGKSYLPDYGNKGNGNSQGGNGNGNGNGNGSTTSFSDFSSRISALLNQLHGLQNLFNHGGK